MIENVVTEYIHTMLLESGNGELTIGTGEDQRSYLMEWDSETAEKIAQQCCTLLAQLTELGKHFQELCDGSIELSEELMKTWKAYAMPADDHNLDTDALVDIGKKQGHGDPLTPHEQALSEQADLLFRQDALRRLPYKRRMPIQLQSSAHIYALSVWLDRPEDWLLELARRLAEEMVLYHCAKPFHICRCCRTLFYEDAKPTDCPNCGYRLIKGVDF